MQENNLIHQAFPVSDGDDSIRQDVLSQAVSLRSRHQHQTRTKRTVVGSIATLFVVGSALTIGPAAYAYYRIQAISNSVSDCKSAIMQSYDIGPDGRAKPSGTITFANGNWRIEGLGRTQVYTKSTLWSYDPKNQRVTKRFKPDGPFGYNPSGFSIGAMIADFDRFKWGTNAQLGSATIEGRPAET